MKPAKEKINLQDRFFPLRMMVNSSSGRQMHVHPHWHEEIEVLYVMSGKAVQQVNANRFDIVQGDLVLIGSNDVHSTYTNREEETDILVLQFDSAFLMPPDYLAPERKLIQAFSSGIDFQKPVKTEVGYGREMLNWLLEIKEESQIRNTGFELFVKSNLLKLIGSAVRCPAGLPKIAGREGALQRAREMLKNTFFLIDRQYHENLTVEKAAQVSSLSVAHFCRLFKMAAGITFAEYLALYRINRAEELLSTTRSITDICYECGFGSLTSFTRTFKRLKNCSPTTYRNKHHRMSAEDKAGISPYLITATP